MHAVTPENGLPSFKPSRQSIATSSLVTWRKEERAPVIRNLLRAACRRAPKETSGWPVPGFGRLAAPASCRAEQPRWPSPESFSGAVLPVVRKRGGRHPGGFGAEPPHATRHPTLPTTSATAPWPKFLAGFQSFSLQPQRLLCFGSLDPRAHRHLPWGLQRDPTRATPHWHLLSHQQSWLWDTESSLPSGFTRLVFFPPFP